MFINGKMSQHGIQDKPSFLYSLQNSNWELKQNANDPNEKNICWTKKTEENARSLSGRMESWLFPELEIEKILFVQFLIVDWRHFAYPD